MKVKSKALGLFLVAVFFMLSATCSAEESPASEAPANPLEAVYENFVKEGSDYDKYKQSILQYFENVSVTAVLDGESITVTVDSKNEYMESGSWKFTQDGEYLTARFGNQDILGSALFDFFLKPVGEALKMDPVLFSSYIRGLQVMEMENDYISVTQEEDGFTLRKLYDASPFDMADIDDIYITEKVAQDYMFPSSGDDSFYSMPIGKIRFVAHGNADSMVMAIGEYGESTDKSYYSLINAVNVIQPTGYQAFLNSFTQLSEIVGDTFRVTSGVDDDTKDYLSITDEYESFSFYTVRFFSPDRF